MGFIKNIKERRNTTPEDRKAVVSDQISQGASQVMEYIFGSIVPVATAVEVKDDSVMLTFERDDVSTHREMATKEKTSLLAVLKSKFKDVEAETVRFAAPSVDGRKVVDVNDMQVWRNRTVVVIPTKHNGGLTGIQKKFDGLTNKIAGEKANAATWEARFQSAGEQLDRGGR